MTVEFISVNQLTHISFYIQQVSQSFLAVSKGPFWQVTAIYDFRTEIKKQQHNIQMTSFKIINIDILVTRVDINYVFK